MPNQPSLVTLTIQPGRLPGGSTSSGKDDLVADERQRERRAGHGDEPAAIAGEKPAALFGELLQAETFEEVLERQIFAERHQMHFVVERTIEPSWSMT
jgi:hypothetical protein